MCRSRRRKTSGSHCNPSRVVCARWEGFFRVRLLLLAVRQCLCEQQRSFCPRTRSLRSASRTAPRLALACVLLSLSCFSSGGRMVPAIMPAVCCCVDCMGPGPALDFGLVFCFSSCLPSPTSALSVATQCSAYMLCYKNEHESLCGRVAVSDITIMSSAVQ